MIEYIIIKELKKINVQSIKMDEMRMQMEAMMKQLTLQQQKIDTLTKQKSPVEPQKNQKPSQKERYFKEEKVRIENNLKPNVKGTVPKLENEQTLLAYFINQKERQQKIRMQTSLDMLSMIGGNYLYGGHSLMLQHPIKYNQERSRRADRDTIQQGKPKPTQWTKIGEIKPGKQNLNLIVKIISGERIGKRVKAVLGDETGIVDSYLWYCQQLKLNNTIVIFDAQSAVYKEHIQIQTKKRGRLEVAKRKIQKVEESINISLKQWIEQ